MFLELLEAFPQRHDCPPILEPGAVYEALAALKEGDVVPPKIYIKDYDTGTIPAWTVKKCELKDQGQLYLVLIDPNGTIAATLWEPAAEIARDILSTRDRCLATQPYQLRLGYGPKPMMCDLMQQAKYVANDEQRALRRKENV